MCVCVCLFVCVYLCERVSGHELEKTIFCLLRILRQARRDISKIFIKIIIILFVKIFLVTSSSPQGLFEHNLTLLTLTQIIQSNIF